MSGSTFGAKNIGPTLFVGTFGARNIGLISFDGTFGAKNIVLILFDDTFGAKNIGLTLFDDSFRSMNIGLTPKISDQRQLLIIGNITYVWKNLRRGWKGSNIVEMKNSFIHDHFDLYPVFRRLETCIENFWPPCCRGWDPEHQLMPKCCWKTVSVPQ